jgi:hypothetical protein
MAPLNTHTGKQREYQDDGGERSDGMHDEHDHRREDRARQESQGFVSGDDIGDGRRMAIIESDEGAAELGLLQVTVAEIA